ncbi:alpha-ketoglutarate-dependent dioxygenase alkB homolog 7, mitochondrial [Paroedura picta]|uniref:alpha-ketoglutarate-dependent dioxygenase alkB homolog 7, mitochondrial n=1 Tax=Paroedura picta TaxID=143630 RepID=UPI0040579544
MPLNVSCIQRPPRAPNKCCPPVPKLGPCTVTPPHGRVFGDWRVEGAARRWGFPSRCPRTTIPMSPCQLCSLAPPAVRCRERRRTNQAKAKLASACARVPAREEGRAPPGLPKGHVAPRRRGGPGAMGAAGLWGRLEAGGAALLRGFVGAGEEALLARELEPALRRTPYQEHHWDQAIHRYRETEKSHWSPESEAILQRVRDVAFPPHVPQLAQVHVLDLDKTGYIKPHIDSVKFCGCTIAGLSLLSSSVMRLVCEKNPQERVDLLLERRSLYILRGPARYEFTHEILRDEESFFDGQKVPRERRIAIICRNLPLLQA